MFPSKAAFTGLLLLSSVAQADSRVPRQIKLAVGEAEPLHLGFMAMQSVCDDPSVVRVQPSKDNKELEVVGLKEGTTRCGFQDNPKGRRVVVEVVVRAAAELPVPSAGDATSPAAAAR